MTSQAQQDDYKTQEAVAGVVRQLPSYYVGGGTFTLDGANAQQLNVPSDATIFILSARGGEIHFEINGVGCSAASPGHIAEDTYQAVGPLYNLNSLWIFSGTASTVCHYMWFREM